MSFLPALERWPGLSTFTLVPPVPASEALAVLEGLGFGGWGCHANNEHLEIVSIVPRL